MKRLTKAATLAAGAALAFQAAHAGSFVNDDLYLGFDTATATRDYIIDLGQPGVVGAGGSSVADLTGDFSLSTFDSIFNATNGVNLGVVGGNPTFGSYDLYTTELRSGGPGNPAIAGSPDLSGDSHSSGSLSYDVGAIDAMGPNLPAAGTGVADLNKSFYNNIAPTFTASTFYGASGINPLGALDNTGVIYLDLWHATTSSPFAYLGYFTLNVDSSLTFTPAAAPIPEPATLGIFALAGLVCLLFRHSFKRKLA
ncbi:MAG: PEP-CTERM sorting domain-containing protein [Verrucomicrobiota bacterium]|nr:PEP-CTERM sorting domain-containing protein [Verrucomicrobiota bacterium]